MSLLREIKAAQIAAAKEAGEVNPYDAPVSAVAPTKRVGKLQAIQAKQPKPQPKPIAQAVAKELGDLSHYQTVLDLDIRKVSNQKDLLDKARVKQSVLPTYLDFVDDYVASGDNYPNSVAVQCMIWLLDVVEIEHGLNLALHLIKQGQKMPDKIKRDMPTFLIDTLYDWANAMLKEDHGASPYLDIMVATAEKDTWDVHPLCMSKSYAMLAKHHVRNSEYEIAHDLCLKAQKVNPTKHGVKLLTEEIEKQLAKKDT